MTSLPCIDLTLSDNDEGDIVFVSQRKSASPTSRKRPILQDPSLKAVSESSLSSVLCEGDLLASGWRKEPTKDLPCDIAGDVVFIAPWGPPKDLSYDQARVIWKNAVLNKHYFLTYNDACLFMDSHNYEVIASDPCIDISNRKQSTPLSDNKQDTLSCSKPSNSNFDIPTTNEERAVEPDKLFESQLSSDSMCSTNSSSNLSGKGTVNLSDQNSVQPVESLNDVNNPIINILKPTQIVSLPKSLTSSPVSKKVPINRMSTELEPPTKKAKAISSDELKIIKNSSNKGLTKANQNVKTESSNISPKKRNRFQLENPAYDIYGLNKPKFANYWTELKTLGWSQINVFGELLKRFGEYSMYLSPEGSRLYLNSNYNALIEGVNIFRNPDQIMEYLREEKLILNNINAILEKNRRSEEVLSKSKICKMPFNVKESTSSILDAERSVDNHTSKDQNSHTIVTPSKAKKSQEIKMETISNVFGDSALFNGMHVFYKHQVEGVFAWIEGEVLELQDTNARLRFASSDDKEEVIESRSLSTSLMGSVWWPSSRFFKELSKGCISGKVTRFEKPDNSKESIQADSSSHPLEALSTNLFTDDQPPKQNKNSLPANNANPMHNCSVTNDASSSVIPGIQTAKHEDNLDNNTLKISTVKSTIDLKIPQHDSNNIQKIYKSSGSNSVVWPGLNSTFAQSKKLQGPNVSGPSLRDPPLIKEGVTNNITRPNPSPNLMSTSSSSSKTINGVNDKITPSSDVDPRSQNLDQKFHSTLSYLKNSITPFKTGLIPTNEKPSVLHDSKNDFPKPKSSELHNQNISISTKNPKEGPQKTLQTSLSLLSNNSKKPTSSGSKDKSQSKLEEIITPISNEELEREFGKKLSQTSDYDNKSRDKSFDPNEIDSEAMKWMPGIPSKLSDFILAGRAEISEIMNESGDNLRLSEVWDQLHNVGWRLLSSSCLDVKKYDTCYVAPWATYVFNMDATSSRALKVRALKEGRDYFFENDMLLDYLKKYRNYYNHEGVQADLKSSRRKSSQESQNSQVSVSSASVSSPFKNPIQLETHRTDIQSLWKLRGHKFDQEADVYINQNIRRFVHVKTNSSITSKKYFDGKCVSYCPPTSNEDGSIRPAEWGVSYYDINAFTNGCEVISLLDLRDAIHAFRAKLTSHASNAAITSYLPEDLIEKLKPSRIELDSKPYEIEIDKLKKSHFKELQELKLQLHECQKQLKYHAKCETVIDETRKLAAKHETQYKNEIFTIRNAYVSEIQKLKASHNDEMQRLRYQFQKQTNELQENFRRKQAMSQFKSSKSSDMSSDSSSTMTAYNSNETTLDWKMKLWREYMNNILTLSNRKRLASSSSSSQAEESFVRHEVSVRRDENYPLAVTVEVFKNLSPSQQCSLLKVVFKRYEEVKPRPRIITNRFNFPNSNTVDSITDKRRVEVADQARDDGGLLRQWMNDFLEELKVHVLTFDHQFSSADKGKAGKSASIKCLENFRIMNSNGIHYLPSILRSSDGKIKISLEEDEDDTPEANEARLGLRDIYVTLGKVLNYLMREGIPIPSPFASPFLILYLINGSIESVSGCLSLSSSYLRRFSHQLVDRELVEAVINVDSEYTGYANHVSLPLSESFYEEFLYPCIIQPREEAFIAIKEGFDCVPLAGHLQCFTYQQFYDNFVGEDVYEWDDVKGHIVYAFAEGDKFSVDEEESFQSTVSEALSRLDPDEIRNLLMLATGSTLFKKNGLNQTNIKIMPNVIWFEDAHADDSFTENHVKLKRTSSNSKSLTILSSRYPSWPLPKSYTCFEQLFIPYFKILPSNAPEGSNSNDSPATQLWTVNNVCSNIRAALNHCNGDFCDHGIRARSS